MSECIARLQELAIEDRSVERRAVGLAVISRRMMCSLVAEGELLDRVEHVLFFINDDTLEFEPLDDVVHADEKWLYEDKDKRSYLLFPGENPTHHIRKSKKFIPKTMFLAACCWNGKLELWPLTEKYIAQRSSCNCPKGTVCTRNIEVVNRAVYKDFLIRLVIPAIKKHWPCGD
ncbi:hypothetical protein L915_05004 [Phytophthora nicotianae]|uniref:Uncharacterized protein n=2 Tax=Phytophthora nicotianae TaxID=4792 RepID=W2NRH3_PHYNI|nr:hypothetical protein L915_05004 [Phytophthora nicotianae]ETM51120.1 hypothetical protein L914_04959 [Phytophthora nicotianae]